MLWWYELSLSFFALSCTLLSSGWNWSFPSTTGIHSTVNSFLFFLPSPSLSFPSMASLCSAALLPCCFLYHSALSFIMHVKQTDMSESLKGLAVPSLQLHQPWGGWLGGDTSQRPLCATWVQLNYRKTREFPICKVDAYEKGDMSLLS